MAIIFSKGNRNGNSYIAFFDLDRTIIKTISGKALVRSAFKKGLMTHSGLINAIFLSLVFRLKLKDPFKIIDEMAGWIEGLSEKVMFDLCSEVFHEVLLPSVYQNTRTEIEMHKEKNAITVILSSAITPVCREVAKCLGMDDIVCTDLEVINEHYTGRSNGPPCFGEEKVSRLKKYCEKNNSIPKEAWYYGDSFSDFPVLNTVGHPVCINPDRKLKKKAIEKGWSIYYWR